MLRNVNSYSFSWLQIVVSFMKGVGTKIFLYLGVYLLLSMVALFISVVFDWYQKTYKFDQPRDALVQYLPGYNDTYREMRNMCITTNCPQAVIDRHVTPYRDSIIKAGWPFLVNKMMDEDSWHRNVGDGWAIRDDWFNLVSQVGGQEKMKSCMPIVVWYFSSGVKGVFHEVKGVTCGSKEFFLNY